MKETGIVEGSSGSSSGVCVSVELVSSGIEGVSSVPESFFSVQAEYKSMATSVCIVLPV